MGNGSGEKEASRALSVSQYPTLLIFYKDKAYRYTGGHLEREIVNYLKFWKPNEEHEIDLRVDAFTPVKEEDVLELDDSTFFNAVEEYKTIAAFIYAPWCGHCKSFHPIFDKAASYLAAKDIPVQMIRVDGSANREVAWRYNVSSYPFVAVIENGTPYTFRGKRSANGVVNYLRFFEPVPTEVISMNEPSNKIGGGSGSRRANNKRDKEAVPQPVISPAKVELLDGKEEL